MECSTSGERRTAVKRGELKPGAFRGMLKQLDIPKEDFRCDTPTPVY